MADNPFTVSVPNPLQALMSFDQSYDAGRKRVNEQKVQAARREAEQSLAAGGDPRSALAKLLGAGDVQGAEVLAKYRGAEIGANGVYGNVIYGTGPNGETLIGTHDKSGKFRPIDTGVFTPTLPAKPLDTGTGFVMTPGRMPFQNGQPVQGAPQGRPGAAPIPGAPQGPAMSGGYIPKDVAGAEQEKKVGAAQGEAIAGLPGVIAKAEESVRILDQAIKHPGRATATGVSGLIDPRNYIPATDATNYKVLAKQIEGTAFLEAFESLKGGGQITEVEGIKATQAKARLDRAQSDEEYLSALKDLKEVISRGVARAKNKAANIRTSPRPSMAAPSPPSPQIQEGSTATNPQTGQKIQFRGGQWVPMQ